MVTSGDTVTGVGGVTTFNKKRRERNRGQQQMTSDEPNGVRNWILEFN
jgi:hypothetical protein